MIYRHFLRACFACLLLAVAPTLSHCGAGIGTETGNPPGIIQQKLYLELVENGVRVVGNAGAITPSAASVRVTNRATGESVDAIAGADGSLDVVVPGAAGDEYEVTVSSGGQEVSEPISFAQIAQDPDVADLTCQALESTLSGNLLALVESADASCAVDDDCTFAYWSDIASCYDQCSYQVLSYAGLADAQMRGDRSIPGVCAPLEACDRPPPASCPLVQAVPTCREGRCLAIEAERASCGGPELEDAAALRTRLRAEADRTCSVDADCRLANVVVSCLPDCDFGVESVSQAAAADLEASLRDQVDLQLCQPYLARGCFPPVVDCSVPPGPPEAFCDVGSCAVRYVP
jgi:hypothetical protein